jgi:hypothetical protein
MKFPFIKIAGLENGIEAQLVESILNEHEIPHRIRSYYDTAYDGLFQVQKGWGEIHAPTTFMEPIREILRAVRAHAQDDNLK